MYQHADIKEGMTVRSEDGHKLGKVYAVDEREFHIEKGLFFPKDYSVRYGEISAIRDGEIVLLHGKDSLRSFSDALASSRVVARSAETALPGQEPLAATPMRRSGDLQGLWMNKGLRTDALSSDDLGNQEVGPYNTDGARASPFLTEEDRAAGQRSRPTDLPPALSMPLDSPAARPAMRASFEEPLRGRDVADELYDDPREPRREEREDEEAPRRLGYEGDEDLTKRRL